MNGLVIFTVFFVGLFVGVVMSKPLMHGAVTIYYAANVDGAADDYDRSDFIQ